MLKKYGLRVKNKAIMQLRIQFIFAIIITLLPVGLMAQDYTISGYMRDAKSGEELLYANVLVKETGAGAVTNLYGFYSITLPKGTYTIQYSYIGMDTKEMMINLKQ